MRLQRYLTEKIIVFPDNRQVYNYDCGASAVQSIMNFYGHDIREDDIIKALGSDKKSGTDVEQIKRYFKDKGIKFIEVEGFTVDKLKEEIDANHPVIILVQAWVSKDKVDWANEWDAGHYVIAIGYDSEKFVFEDPSVNTRSTMTPDELDVRWHDREGKKKYVHWGLVFPDKGLFNPNRTVEMK
jgi:ABC-type bacteriocin/lantibiotic exporter with double-glycine peptidase domain